MRKDNPHTGGAAGQSAALALSPIVRALVADGIGAGEAAAILRRLYVQQVRSNLVSSRKRATVAAISAVTGLTRLEVRQHLANRVCRQPWHESRLARVMTGWRSDPEFADNVGRPAQLPYAGRPRGFASLVAKYAGDVPPRAVLNELLDRQMVVRTGENYSPCDDVSRMTRSSAMDALAQIIPSVADTIWHNKSARSLDKRFIGMTVAQVSTSECERVALQLGKLSSSFITRSATQLKRHSQSVPTLPPTRARSIGVIAVCIEAAAPDDFSTA
jgi:Family of unknown function (DUF6502)